MEEESTMMSMFGLIRNRTRSSFHRFQSKRKHKRNGKTHDEESRQWRQQELSTKPNVIKTINFRDLIKTRFFGHRSSDFYRNNSERLRKSDTVVRVNERRRLGRRHSFELSSNGLVTRPIHENVEPFVARMLTPQQQNDKMVVVAAGHGGVVATESTQIRPGKYGPGHEKHPSWPMPVAEDVPLSQRGPQTGTSYRSKSWTDQTNYPKETPVPYSRPFMFKKQPRPLKTVMEKCEKLQTDNFFQQQQQQQRHQNQKKILSTATINAKINHKLKTRSIEDYLYADLDLKTKSSSNKLPHMIAVSSDQSSQKHYNCPYQDVMVVVRDTKKLKSQQSQQHLTQADLDAYTKSYETRRQNERESSVHSKQHSIGSYSSSSGSSSGCTTASGTTAVHLMHHQHQKQSSYAQSEGYHSYVSTTDSSSVSTSLSTPTPFLDRLRRDTDATIVAQTKSSKSSLCDTEGRDSVVTNSSGSGSSNDTLKWHGSLSDVSTMSGSFGRDPELLLIDGSYDSDFLNQQQQQKQSIIPNSSSDLKHLIAHSSKVQAPQKHHSESVMFIESQNLCTSDDNEDDDDDDDNNDDDNSSGDDNDNEIDRQRCFALSRKSMRKIRTVKNNELLSSTENVVDDEAVRKLRLFPVSTYTIRPQATIIPRSSSSSIIDNGYSSMASTEFYPSARSSVAERINDIELKQQMSAAAAAAAAVTTIAGTQPITTVPISNYAQQQQLQIDTSSWKSEPHLSTSSSPPPPLPPPLKPKSIVPNPNLPRRSSICYSLDLPPVNQPSHYQQQFADNDPNCSTLIGPVICGPAISVDDWVPERPPKNPNLLKQIYKEMNATRAQQKRNSCSSNSTSSNNSQRSSGAITSSDSTSTIIGLNIDDDNRAIGADKNDADDVTNVEFSDQNRSLSMATSSMTMNRAQYKTSNKKSLLATSSLSSSLSSSSAHYATATTLTSNHSTNGVYKRTISPQNRPTLTAQLPPPPPLPSLRSKQTLYPAPNATTITTSSTDRKVLLSPSSTSPLISKIITEGSQSSDLLPIQTSSSTTAITTTTTTTTSTTSTNLSDNDCSCSDDPTTITTAGTISSTSGCDTSLGSSASSSSSSTTSSFKSRSNSLQNSPILTNRQSKNDMASQTDDLMPLTLFTAAIKTKSLMQPQSQKPCPQSAIKVFDDKLPLRKKFPEEIDCETLSQDLINHLSSTDRLKCILTPVPESKKISDYISGLYRPDIISQPLKSSLSSQNKMTTVSAAATTVTTMTTTSSISTEPSNKSSSNSENQSFASVTTTSNPVFLATSESKAKILSKLNYNFNEYKITQDTKYLQKKKMELINRLNRKLDVLRNERNSLDKESVRNNNLGANITNHLTQYATSRELVKFQMYIEEIDNITNLLLSLTLRLVRTENILLISECANEKKILDEKRLKLHEQLKDAKKLKECIQRKSLQIAKMLNKYLNNDELCDYNHFINWKAKLIIETREINDKIELSENQMQALKSSLNNI